MFNINKSIYKVFKIRKTFFLPNIMSRISFTNFKDPSQLVPSSNSSANFFKVSLFGPGFPPHQCRDIPFFWGL